MTMNDIDAAYAKAIAEAVATYEAARAAFHVRFAAMVAMAPKCVTTSNTKEAP